MTDKPETPTAPEAVPLPEAAPISASWQPIKPLAPWTNVAGTIPLAMRRVGDRLEIMGAVACGGAGRHHPIFQLPANVCPPGWIARPVAVVGAYGIGIVTIGTNGHATISTDNWSGDVKFYDLGLVTFPVDPVLAERIKRDAMRARPKAVRTENRGGVIVATP